MDFGRYCLCLFPVETKAVSATWRTKYLTEWNMSLGGGFIKPSVAVGTLNVVGVR